MVLGLLIGTVLPLLLLDKDLPLQNLVEDGDVLDYNGVMKATLDRRGPSARDEGMLRLISRLRSMCFSSARSIFLLFVCRLVFVGLGSLD